MMQLNGAATTPIVLGRLPNLAAWRGWLGHGRDPNKRMAEARHTEKKHPFLEHTATVAEHGDQD